MGKQPHEIAVTYILCDRCRKKRTSTEAGISIAICKRCQKRIDERNKLAQSNEKLVWFAINRFFRRHPKIAAVYPRDDAYNDGFTGLMRACELYDETKGKFSTYAYYWICQALGRAWEKGGGLVRVPSYCRSKVRITINRMDKTIMEGIVGEYDDEIEPRDISARVQSAIDKLHFRWARLVRMRMTGMTLKECGEAMGVTRERARQLEVKAHQALAKLLGKFSEKLFVA